MNVITIESEAFQKIMDRFSGIENSLKSKTNCSPLNETWLDISETCQLLKISKRTLQSYRDQRLLAFSQISGKIYFSAKDIQDHLQRNYVQSKIK